MANIFRIKEGCVIEGIRNDCFDCDRLGDDECVYKKLLDIYRKEEYDLLVRKNDGTD